MIVRLWHGRTAAENADAYERPLHEEIFRGVRRALRTTRCGKGDRTSSPVSAMSAEKTTRFPAVHSSVRRPVIDHSGPAEAPA
jgi:hypothetical protein